MKDFNISNVLSIITENADVYGDTNYSSIIEKILSESSISSITSKEQLIQAFFYVDDNGISNFYLMIRKKGGVDFLNSYYEYFFDTAMTAQSIELIRNALNAVINVGCFKDESALLVLTGQRDGVSLLATNECFLAKLISPTALNKVVSEGKYKTLSPLFHLCKTVSEDFCTELADVEITFNGRKNKLI